ncbi:MAG: beta strand repeat-containing protein [Bryobacteraceae bacterium]
MRSILLVGVAISTLLPAASAEALTAHIATGFIAQPSPGHFWAMSSSYRASFGPTGIQLVRRGRRAAVRFPGARLDWQAEGESDARVHFLGAGSRSFAGAAALRARNAFPGVDIVVRLRDGRLKSEFQLAAGVSPSVAGYCLEGAKVRVDGQSLHIDAGEGWQWREEGLESWQDSLDGGKILIRSEFMVTGQCVHFRTAKVDPALPLTIDPELVFSSFMGGGMFDAITAVATDAQGNMYLGGWTESSDFPSLSGYQTASAGRIDGFVAKVNSLGQLVFATYLGGSNEDRVQAIVVDGAGVITLAGLTNSTNFPTLAPARGALAGGRDAFITRLYPAGNQLVFSTYLGGLAHDSALAVTLDSSGNIVVAGETASTDFPTQSAYSTSSGGGVDGFLARFSPTGGLLSSSYFGGAADDRIRGVAVGGDGTLHVTGSTASSNFPVASAPYPSLRGSMDGFYTRFNGAATAVSLSTYLGGAGGSSLSEEAGYGITIDALGRAWIAGVTPSTDFPGVSSGSQPAYGGGSADAFISVFTTGGSLEWSTYLGGTGIDAATSISAGSGFVGLAGYTTSNNLPVSGALQPARAGEYDAFWAVFPIVSTTPLYVSYLGGGGSDSALAVAANGSAMAIGGSTLSSNFPLRTPIQSGNPGAYGGFISRLRFGPGPIAVSPDSGAGAAATFTFNIAHANGSAAIQNAAFLFNSSYSFTAGCHVYYDRGTNLISLFKDAGAAWLSLTPGAAVTVDNGVCSINGSGVTVNSTANSLVLALPVAFAGSFIGTRQIYANANDSSGLGAGWPLVGEWNVVIPIAPTVGTVTPASGTGLSQSFTFTFSDANGAADIAGATVFINNVFSGANACYFTYGRAANTISLFRDSDSAFLPVTPGVNTTVENTKCSITGTGASVTTAETLLTLTVPVTFKPTFNGPRTIYASAGDAGGLSSDWKPVGTWTPVPILAPAVSSLLPSSGSGAAQTFSVTFADGNGYADIVNTAFLVNSTISAHGGCYLTFSKASNTLSLFRDSDSAYLPITPGANTTVENTYCSIAGAGFVVSAGGTQLVLTIPVTFKSTLTGIQNIYASVTDAGGLTTGWQTVGSWTPFVAYTPAVGGVAPASGSGTSRTFTFTLADGNGYPDITGANFLVNTSAGIANGCAITYSKSSNTFALYRDSDAALLPITPGAAGSVENANCSLAGTGLTVTGNGSQLVFTIPITFKTSFSGTKTIFAAAIDSGGLTSGWQSIGTWNPGSSAQPTVTSVSPNAGGGSTQSFSVVLSDANGFEDISGAVVLVSSVISGNNSCYLFYSRAANLVYLFRDSDGTWLGLAPGASGSVANGNCSLSGNALAISASGTTITLVLPLAFQPSYSGAKNIYVSVNDQSNLTSGWVTAGAWTPFSSPAAPAVASLSPNAGIGAVQTFTLQLSDANGFSDISSAIFLINSALDGNNGCYITFSRVANQFFLFRDSDSSWQPAIPGGSSAENNNCALSGTGLGVSGSGNTLTVTLPLSFKLAFAGTRNFYVTVADAGGLSSGVITAGTWTPPGSPAPPALGSLTPNAGSGATQTFTAVLSDANGFTDIASAIIVINNTLSGSDGCYISFSRAANVFYLFRDSDGSWQPVTPGAGSSATNANCTLSGAGLSVTGSGATLTVVLPLSFKPVFSGARNFYINVADNGSLSSGWITAGTWNPSGAPAAPTVASLTPNSGGGATQTFTAVLTDANGFTDIASAIIVINDTLSGSNACYISFNRAANAFYLFRDSDGSWQAVTPGGGSSATNNNCTLSGAGLSASGAGNSLTVVLPLSFKPAFAGARNLYFNVADAASLSSGWITAGTWNPSGSTAPPTVTSLSPNAGRGAAQTFTAVLSDASGFADIASVLIVINNTLSGNNACYISYGRAANTFYLFRDSDASWQAIVPGAGSSVTNANCTLSGTGLSVTGAGNSLTVTLPLSFKPAFAGLRNFYLMVADAGSLSSGWITAGTWNGV